MRIVLLRAIRNHAGKWQSPIRQPFTTVFYALAFAIGFAVTPLLVRHASTPLAPRAALRHVATPASKAREIATFVVPSVGSSRAAEPERALNNPNVPPPSVRSIVPPRKSPLAETRRVATRRAGLPRPRESAAARVAESSPHMTRLSLRRRATVPLPVAGIQQSGENDVAAPQAGAAAPQARPAGPTVRNYGTLIAVNGNTLTLSIGSKRAAIAHDFCVTPGTVIYAGSERIAFTRLHEFVGTSVNVWSAQIDENDVAGRIVLLASRGGRVSPTSTGGGAQDAIFTNGNSGAGSGGGSIAAGNGGSSSTGSSGGTGSSASGSGGGGGLAGAIEHALGSVLK
jgi:hypothetical protein